MCRDVEDDDVGVVGFSFNAARSIVCVGTMDLIREVVTPDGFNAARSIVCVGT